MANDAKRQAHIDKLADLIEDLKFCMLTTVDDDGHLHSRPMAMQNERFDGDLWFFTRDDSNKVEQVLHNRQVNVAFARPGDQTYLSMAGRAKLIKGQPDKKKALWHPAHRAWFPDGLDDPHLALLRVQVETAEYWDSPASPIVFAIGLAKAALTGKPYQGLGSENEEVDIDKKGGR